MAKEGDPVPTGWAPLDNRLRRNGVPPGRVISIGGPPFAGKTTVVVDIALHMSATIPVFALFSDEGRAQAASRIGVMLGVSLDDIEKSPAAAASRMKELLGERSITMLKPESEFSTAEDVFAYVTSKVPRGEPAGVFLDSVQTIPARRNMEASSEREAYKEFMKVVRAETSGRGYITVLSSQANRASYRSRKAEDNAVAMASFSGTAAIEFLSDVAFVLSLPDETSDIVKVEVVKNRLVAGSGRLPRSFHVRYDSERGRMQEVDAAELDNANVAAHEERLRPAKSKILYELNKASDGLTTNQISELTRTRKATVIDALGALDSGRKVFRKKEGRQILYFSVSP